MAQSIIIVGPQGCGKTINAKGLCKAFGLTKWVDAADVRALPKEGHIIFAYEWPRHTSGLQCINFDYAITKVDKPHPLTPKARS